MENSHNEPKYIEVRGACVHNLKNVNVNVPLHQIVGIAGVSGSGKTTMVLESLIPGLEASLNHTHLPEHVKSVVADGISHVKLIDASPIGINVRSTVATYANVHDELRKVYAKTTEAKNLKHKAGDFSYNTGKLKCPVCDGTGQISLDVQFLPDVDVPCQATDRVRPLPSLSKNTSIAPFEVEHSTSGGEPLYIHLRIGNKGTPYNYSA